MDIKTAFFIFVFWSTPLVQGLNSLKSLERQFDQSSSYINKQLKIPYQKIQINVDGSLYEYTKDSNKEVTTSFDNVTRVQVGDDLNLMLRINYDVINKCGMEAYLLHTNHPNMKPKFLTANYIDLYSPGKAKITKEVKLTESFGHENGIVTLKMESNRMTLTLNVKNIGKKINGNIFVFNLYYSKKCGYKKLHLGTLIKVEDVCKNYHGCLNNGICVRKFNKKGEPIPGCKCKLGYYGKYCGKESCKPRSIFFHKYESCQYGGKSVPSTKWPFCQCTCPDGFKGDYCERSPCMPGSDFFEDKSKCWNGGVANTTQNYPFCKCQCKHGYTGTFCEKTIKCKKSQNNDLCDDGISVCKFLKEKKDYYCFQKETKDYCMGSTGKVHCSDKDEKCLEFTSVTNSSEVFHICMNIYTEKTYHSSEIVQPPKRNKFIVFYVCGSFALLFLIISIGFFVCTRVF